MATIKNINAYPEFRTETGINRIINYVRTGIIHPAIQNVNRYIEKFGGNTGFYVGPNNNQLFYLTADNRHLRVARPSIRQDILEHIYNDDELGLGIGLTQFFNQISGLFLNIRKTDTDEFLKKQGDYQITRTPNTYINKPLKSQSANQIWAIDLIDMTAYNQPANKKRLYIFSCVDLYTGKVWARAITNRNNLHLRPTLRTAFESICIEANTLPSIVKCDSEFSQGDINDWMGQHHITIIKSRSHVPTDNSNIERMNREIRKKIRSGFVRHNNFLWVDHLQTYVNNINNQKQIGQTQTPNERWTPGYNRNNNIQLNIIANQNKKAEITFRTNDYVRVKLFSINNKMRAREKQDMETYKSAVMYTPEIYRIWRVYRNGNSRSYALVKPHIPGIQVLPNGLDIAVMGNNDQNYKKFYASDLIKVGTRRLDNINHTSLHPQTNTRAVRLNKIQGNIVFDIE